MNMTRLFLALSLFTLVALDRGEAEPGTDWAGEMNLRFYQGVCAYIDNPEGKAFEISVDVREWNLVENGPREMLFKVYDPEGRVLERKVVADDGVTGDAFMPEAGGWDHEMWYYALCYSRGSVPMIRWSSFTEPTRVARLGKRTISFPVAAGTPGIYRVQMCASRDHVATLRLTPALKYGLAGHPMWMHGHGDMFAKSYIYVPKGTLGMDIGFAEFDLPVTRRFTVTAPDGEILWDGEAKGGLQSLYAEFPDGKYDDQILTLEVAPGEGDYMMHLLLRRGDVRLYRGKGGVPAMLAQTPETARALKNGAIYHDGQVFWHAFQVRLHDYLKGLAAADFVVHGADGNAIEPTLGPKFGWGSRQMVYKGLPTTPGFVPLNGGHEVPPLCDSLMHNYSVHKQRGVLNAALRDLHLGLRMITVGETPVIGGWSGNLGYVYATYGWHYWRPCWRILQQTDAPEEVKDIVREAMILCSDRLAFGRGIERVNGNAFSHIPIALRYAAEATQDPLSRELADTYFERFRTEGWGRGSGISRSGDCQEHFGHDFHYGSYIIANYRAILNDLNPPAFRAVIDRLGDLYTYMYCPEVPAYPWGARTAQAAGAGRYGWKGEPGPSFTVNVNDGSEWFAARRPNYYALTFHGRLAPEWLNHYFGTKMGYGGGILCQVTVPGRGPVIASTLSGKYGQGMERFNWRRFHIHSLVGEMVDGRPLVAADSEHLNATFDGTNVTGSGEIRDRPIHVTRRVTFNEDHILCHVHLADTDFRAVYQGRGPSSAMSEAWEMIPFVVGKGRSPKTTVRAIVDGLGMKDLGQSLIPAAGVTIDRGGYGVQVLFDRVRSVKLGTNNTVMVQLANRQMTPAEISLDYQLRPYIGEPDASAGLEREGLPLENIGALRDLSVVGATLAKRPPLVIRNQAGELGHLRLALAGDCLALDVTVTDAGPKRDPVPWKASSLEVFASAPGSRRIGQIFLLPEVGQEPAAALVAAGTSQKPAPEVRLRTELTDKGYRIQVLIPLTSLGLAPDQTEMTLEFQIGAFLAGGKKMSYATLFDSVHAYEDNRRYGFFQVSEAE